MRHYIAIRLTKALEASGEPPFHQKVEGAKFYSNASRLLDSRMGNKPLPVAHVRGILKDVPKDEMQWTGLHDYLSHAEGAGQPVHKSELHNVIHNTMPTIKRSWGQEDNGEWKRWRGNLHTFENAKHELSVAPAEHEYDHDNEEYIEPPVPYTLEHNGTLVDYFDDPDDAKQAGLRHIGLHEPKYAGNYGTDGGENYREAVFHSPDIKPYANEDDSHFGDVTDQRGIGWYRGQVHDTEGDGRALHLDEIQSKRHQEGEDIGYRTPEHDKLIQKHDALYRELRRLALERSNLIDVLSQQTQGMFHKILGRSHDLDVQTVQALKNAGADVGLLNKYQDLQDKTRSVHNEQQQAEAAVLNANVPTEAVPDAPLKGDHWPQFIIKQALHDAAKEGHTHLTWTPGEVQNERWALSNVVDKLDYDPKHGMLNGYKDGKRVATKDVTLDELPQYVGKELAAKLLAQTPSQDEYGDDIHTLEGKGLEVGGSGMNNFYGSLNPETGEHRHGAVGKFLEKYLARFGVKPEPIAINDPFLDENRKNAFGVKITPEMRQSIIEEGQPLWGHRDLLRKAIVIIHYGKLIKADAYRSGQLNLFGEPTFKDTQASPDPVYGKKQNPRARHEWISRNRQILTNAVKQSLGLSSDPTPEDVSRYLNIIRRRMKPILGRSVLATRVHLEALPGIVESGRLLNQFVTQTSGGILNNQLRANTEKEKFDIPENADPHRHRPDYGYLYTPGNSEQPYVGQYGHVELVLKPHVKKRSTFTAGDSLGNDVLPAPIANPSVEAFDVQWQNPYNLTESQISGGSGTPYTEAQIHGGITPHDISHIVLHSPVDVNSRWGRGKHEALHALAEQGIPIHMNTDAHKGKIWEKGQGSPEDLRDALGTNYEKERRMRYTR